VVAYPKVPQLATSATYTVAVNGVSVPVGSYAGHGVAWFAFSGSANVVVTVSQAVASYTLSPKRNPVPATVSGNTISFTLAGPRQLILRDVNALAEDLFLFADALETNPPQPGAAGVISVTARGADPTGAASSVAAFQSAVDSVAAVGTGVVYVPAGQYRIGSQVLLKTGVNLYLAPGAFVVIPPGSSFVNETALPTLDAHNVTISGRGAIYGNSAQQTAQQWAAIAINVQQYNVQDVMFMDTFTTPIKVAGIQNSGFSNVKIIAGSSHLSDGIDIEASQYVTVDHTFIYSTDDHIAIGAGADIRSTLESVNNITIKNSLFDHAGGHMISVCPFKGVPYIQNVVVDNCDHIRGGEILAIYPMGGTNVSNFTFSNLRFEQATSKYMDVFCGDCTSWGAMNCGSPMGVMGYVHDVTLNNVTVDNIPTNGAIFNAPLSPSSDISAVNFNNVYVGGQLATSAATAHLQEYGYVSNITFTHN
jgi:polygalacturonase